MIIELRKKSQITIPKEIADQLHLQAGDHFEISVKDGAVLLETVAIYSKSYIQKLEDTETTDKTKNQKKAYKHHNGVK